MKIRGNLRVVVDRDGAAILDVARNQITTLNSSGAFVWERLEQGYTANAIIDELAIACHSDRATVVEGVQRFLQELVAKDLIAR